MKYKYPFPHNRTFHKFGVDITPYDLNAKDFNFVYESTEEGHFEEFYSDVSTYTWFVIEGSGTFVVNDEKIKVTAKDVFSVPPKNKIHYFGKMKMVLITTPPFNEKNEHHVRDVDKSESPYIK